MMTLFITMTVFITTFLAFWKCYKKRHGLYNICIIHIRRITLPIIYMKGDSPNRRLISGFSNAWPYRNHLLLEILWRVAIGLSVSGLIGYWLYYCPYSVIFCWDFLEFSVEWPYRRRSRTLHNVFDHFLWWFSALFLRNFRTFTGNFLRIFPKRIRNIIYKYK